MCVCAVACVVITCQTDHAMNQRGEVWVILYLISQSLPPSFCPHGTISSFHATLVVNLFFYLYSFYFEFFFLKLSLEGLKWRRCGNECVYALLALQVSLAMQN